jgi:hypothetical protein
MIHGLVRSMEGGFDAVNNFVRMAVRDALLSMHAKFEQDFAGVLNELNTSAVIRQRRSVRAALAFTWRFRT